MQALFGIRIDGPQRAGLCGHLFSLKKPYNHIVTLNAEIFVKALHDPALRKAVNDSALIVPDGQGIVWAAKKHRLTVYEKVAGVDLVYDLLNYANAHEKSIYLLGSKAHCVSRAAGKIRNYYPHLRLVGFHDGYFDSGEAQKVVTAIRKAGPDILFVGLGGGRQEKWIAKHLPEMKTYLAIGVGGSIDVLAGRQKRAPAFITRLNLEWVYRIGMSPLRWWRIFPLIYFGLIVIFRKNR